CVVALFETRDPVGFERRLGFTRAPLAFPRGLEGGRCRLDLNARGPTRASELIYNTGPSLFGRVQSRELALQRLQRLNRRQIAFLGDPRLVLTLRQAEPDIGHRLLVAPARLARREQGRAVLRVARLAIGHGLVGRCTLVLGRLLAGECFTELDHRLAPGVARKA